MELSYFGKKYATRFISPFTDGKGGEYSLEILEADFLGNLEELTLVSNSIKLTSVLTDNAVYSPELSFSYLIKDTFFYKKLSFAPQKHIVILKKEGNKVYFKGFLNEFSYIEPLYKSPFLLTLSSSYGFHFLRKETPTASWGTFAENYDTQWHLEGKGLESFFKETFIFSNPFSSTVPYLKKNYKYLGEYVEKKRESRSYPYWLAQDFKNRYDFFVQLCKANGIIAYWDYSLNHFSFKGRFLNPSIFKNPPDNEFIKTINLNDKSLFEIKATSKIKLLSPRNFRFAYKISASDIIFDLKGREGLSDLYHKYPSYDNYFIGGGENFELKLRKVGFSWDAVPKPRDSSLPTKKTVEGLEIDMKKRDYALFSSSDETPIFYPFQKDEKLTVAVKYKVSFAGDFDSIMEGLTAPNSNFAWTETFREILRRMQLFVKEYDANTKIVWEVAIIDDRKIDETYTRYSISKYTNHYVNKMAEFAEFAEVLEKGYLVDGGKLSGRAKRELNRIRLLITEENFPPITLVFYNDKAKKNRIDAAFAVAHAKMKDYITSFLWFFFSLDKKFRHSPALSLKLFAKDVGDSTLHLLEDPNGFYDGINEGDINYYNASEKNIYNLEGKKVTIDREKKEIFVDYSFVKKISLFDDTAVGKYSIKFDGKRKYFVQVGIVNLRIINFDINLSSLYLDWDAGGVNTQKAFDTIEAAKKPLRFFFSSGGTVYSFGGNLDFHFQEEINTTDFEELKKPVPQRDGKIKIYFLETEDFLKKKPLLIGKKANPMKDEFGITNNYRMSIKLNGGSPVIKGLEQEAFDNCKVVFSEFRVGVDRKSSTFYLGRSAEKGRKQETMDLKFLDAGNPDFFVENDEGKIFPFKKNYLCHSFIKQDILFSNYAKNREKTRKQISIDLLRKTPFSIFPSNFIELELDKKDIYEIVEMEEDFHGKTLKLSLQEVELQ